MIKKKVADHTHIDMSVQRSILNASGQIISTNEKVATVLNLGYYNHSFIQMDNSLRPTYVINGSVPSLSLPGLNWLSSTNTGGYYGASNIITTVVAKTIAAQSSSQFIFKVCSSSNPGVNMIAHSIISNDTSIDCVNRRSYSDTYNAVVGVPVGNSMFVQTLASDFQNKTLQHYVNGVLVSQKNYPTSGTFDPGGNPYHISIGVQDITGYQNKCLFGNVYEIITGTYFMTQSQIIDRQLYLMDKWNI